MKRSLRILVFSVVGSLLPNILLAGHVSVSHVHSVSLLAMDTDQMVQEKNGGITSLFKTTPTITKKVVTPKVVAKTTTKEITKTLEETKALKKAKLPQMVQARWYDWKSDRAKLANEIGIPHYVGTLEQNMKIKNFLLSKIKIAERGRKFATPDIEKTSQEINAINKLPLHKQMKYRWYVWEVDREKLANEVGIVKYVGSKEQNLLIKKHLSQKIKVKKKPTT